MRSKIVGIRASHEITYWPSPVNWHDGSLMYATI